MIPAFLYQWIYLLIVTVITFIVSRNYKNAYGVVEYNDENTLSTLILTIFMIIFIGLRPVSGWYFGDMGGYAGVYEIKEGTPFFFDKNVENLLFDNLFNWWISVRLGCNSFFLLIAAIYYGSAYLGIKRLFPNQSFSVYLVFLAAFSAFGYATNGIKAGAAASLFILAISYRENLKICIPLVLVSWGFHHSMELPVAALILTILYKNPKSYFYFWCFCVIIAAAHISFFQNIFSSMSDEKGAEYLRTDRGEDRYMTGFRPDFVLYSAMPVLVAYYAIFKKQIQLSSMYLTLLNFYLITNGIWMLCMYASFTNRIAYLSWFIYPIVLVYPFLNEDWGENRYYMFGKVMMYHVGFTLFMEVIYYQFINPMV